MVLFPVLGIFFILLQWNTAGALRPIVIMHGMLLLSLCDRLLGGGGQKFGRPLRFAPDVSLFTVVFF